MGGSFPLGFVKLDAVIFRTPVHDVSVIWLNSSTGSCGARWNYQEARSCILFVTGQLHPRSYGSETLRFTTHLLSDWACHASVLRSPKAGCKIHPRVVIVAYVNIDQGAR